MKNDDTTTVLDEDTEVKEWEELGLQDELVKLVKKTGFSKPTPVQSETIPMSLQGRDVIVSARTGSGKTAGFCLPLINQLMDRKGMLGLILCPTRELALQTQEFIDKFGKPLGVSSICFIGGIAIKLDTMALKTNPQILVGTPGRIIDHLNQGNLWLEYIEFLVLDEADQMLDMGFSKAVLRITDEIKTQRQTSLFSATFSAPIEKFAQRILNNPVKFTIDKRGEAPSTIVQELYWVNDRLKNRAVLELVQDQEGSVLIFTRTKISTVKLFRWLHAKGIYDISFISSDKLQSHREEALEGFKSGKYRVLVSTDVAGRGIHVEDVGCVVNFEVPDDAHDYIHRIGRTGRKGQSGRAVTFVTPRDKRNVQLIERELGRFTNEVFDRDYDPDDRGEPRGRGRSSASGGGRSSSSGRSSSGGRSRSGSSGGGSRGRSSSGGSRKKSSSSSGSSRRGGSGGGRSGGSNNR